MSRTVLVTDARRGSAIAFIRSLGSKGWRVIAADSESGSAGFRSRFADETLVYPTPQRSPRAFVECLHERVRASKIDLVVPITDECIHPLSQARQRFEGLTRLAIAPEAALAAVTDKRATLALAGRLGVPVPETRTVTTLAEARAAAAALGYPLVLKPAVSRRYFQDEDRIESGAVSFACDAGELEARLAPLLERHVVLLQRYQAGVGVGVEALARDGVVLRAFQHKRLAEIPVTGGASAWRESVTLDPVLFEHARKLIAELRWTGLIMVEFKLGERPWLIEINGRVWGSLPLACQAGVDFPSALAELYFPGEARAPEAGGAGARNGYAHTNGAHAGGPYRVGVRAYNLELMLSWIAQVLVGRSRHAGLPRPARPRALAGLAGLLDPAQHSDLAGNHDFAPRFAEVRHIARKLARKLGGANAEGKG